MTTKDEGLMPCPFCGNTEDLEISQRRIRIYVGCNECGGEGGLGTDIQEAITAWNTRASAGAGEWIACSERMPEEAGMYLIFLNDLKNLQITHWLKESKTDQYYWQKYASHWMHLPQPPRDGGRG